jgi:hypothetical protein
MALQPLSGDPGTNYDVYTADSQTTVKRYSSTGTKEVESSNTYNVYTEEIVAKPRKTGVVIYDGSLYSFDRNLNVEWSANGGSTFAIDEDGNIYYGNGTDVVKLDSDGNQVGSVTTSFAGTDIDDMVISPRNKESAVYPQAVTSNGSEVSKIDLDNMTEDVHTTNATASSSGGIEYNHNGYLWDSTDANVLNPTDLSKVHDRDDIYGDAFYESWDMNNNLLTHDDGSSDDILYDPFNNSVLETFGSHYGNKFAVSATGTVFVQANGGWQTLGGMQFGSDDQITITGENPGTHPGAYF